MADNTSGTTDAPQGPVPTVKPDVPKPAGPIGGGSPNYTTHSHDPEGVVRLTEDIGQGNESKKD